MQPLVSVLIGAYNPGPYLREAIDSAFAQTHRPLEVVVVDDGSTDGTLELARSYPDVIAVRQERGGNGSARNHAVRLASGALFAFMDADDLSRPERVEHQAAALEAGGLDAVYGQVQEFASPELTPEQRSGLREPAAEPKPWVSANLMLIRREAFERVGPFSETLRVGVTVDWCARAVDAGLKTAVLPEVILDRRIHLTNNGILESGSKVQYAHVLKAALDRRRALAGDGG